MSQEIRIIVLLSIYTFTGELENTVMDTISLASNLRMFFKQSTFPQSLQKYEDIISQCFDQDIRGTLLDDLAWFKSNDSSEDTEELTLRDDEPVTKGAQERAFTPEVYEAFKKFCVSSRIRVPFALNPTALHLKDIRHHEIRYIPDRRPKDAGIPLLPIGDSQVMISCSHKTSLRPAILRDIFKFTLPGKERETYLAIEWRLPEQVPYEWFGKYPILRASVWGDGVETLEIVTASSLKGSYASCAIDDGKYVVIPLDRVSSS